MKKEDFYTGEPVINGSPPFSQEQYCTEQEAIQNAAFGRYDYDPGMRMVTQQPMQMYPGWSGYYPNQVPQYYGYPGQQIMNQPVGIGYPYPGQAFGNGFVGNPALAYLQQQQQFQQPEIKCFISPVNFGGNEYLPPMDIEERISELQREYWMREQEIEAQQMVDQKANGYYNPFGGYPNYYGVPFYNPYQYNSINNELSQEINKILDESRENRKQLNLQLAELAHNYLGDTYDHNELEERYTGREVTVPGGIITPQEVYNYQRFQNMVPFDNSQLYREHDLAVSREFNAVIPKNATMQECFENMGVLNAQYEMEEEKHRRRNGAALYNSENDSYKYFVRRKAAERYAKEKGITLNPEQMMQQTQNAAQIYQQGLINKFPTLQQSAKLCDDGTLNITCNFGSRAGQTYSVHNSQEAEYDKDRERFKGFIDSIPGSIYLNNPNLNGGGGGSGK